MKFAIIVAPALMVAEMFIPATLGAQDNAVVSTQASASGEKKSPQPVAITKADVKITPQLESKIKARLYAEMESNPKFEGAWVEVVVTPERDRFRIVPILDKSQVKEQQQELEKLLNELLPMMEYNLQTPRSRPISKYVAELQASLENDLSLGSCLISGAHFERPAPGSTAQVLMLRGRIADEEQKLLILEQSVEVLQRPEFVVVLEGMLPKPDDMRVVVPSEELASRLFNIGVTKFIKRDYDGAHVAFTRSILEAPRRTKYRYWKIVTEIGQGEMERAYMHLRPLVAMRRQGSRFSYSGDGYASVLESLERVQGPIRQCLHKLEERAYLEGR